MAPTAPDVASSSRAPRTRSRAAWSSWNSACSPSPLPKWTLRDRIPAEVSTRMFRFCSLVRRTLTTMSPPWFGSATEKPSSTNRTSRLLYAVLRAESPSTSRSTALKSTVTVNRWAPPSGEAPSSTPRTSQAIMRHGLEGRMVQARASRGFSHGFGAQLRTKTLWVLVGAGATVRNC